MLHLRTKLNQRPGETPMRWAHRVQTALHRPVLQCMFWEVGPSSAVCTESPPLVWSGHPHKTASTGHGPAAAEYRPPHWPDEPLHTGIKSFFAGKLSHVMPLPCGECPEGRRTRVTQWLESRRWKKKVNIIYKKTSGEIQQTQKRHTPPFLHTEKELPVIQPALVVRVFVNLAQKSVIVKIFITIYYFRLYYCWSSWNTLTFPRAAIRLVSLPLMCLSMLVSPFDMRKACQKVRAPSATPTVLKDAIHLIYRTEKLTTE